MKRLFCVASAGLLMVCLAGCSRGWPSCFCNNNNNDECCEVIQGDECCESNSYYGASGPAVQYVPSPSPAPTKVNELPMPGPDTSKT